MSTSSEQQRSPESRRYRMRKRAEDVEATRRRIVEATVKLHTTVGPANTTISDVAEVAGVTRLTVYRHFPEIDALFAACSGHWLSQHPPPDPAAWRDIRTLRQRTSFALDQLYGWYTANGTDLFPLRRDVAAMPQAVQDRIEASQDAYADALVHDVRLRGKAKRRVWAVARHVVDFWTCRSFVVDRALTTDECVDLGTRFLCVAVDDEQHHRRNTRSATRRR